MTGCYVGGTSNAVDRVHFPKDRFERAELGEAGEVRGGNGVVHHGR
jgi:hypothetical protein